MKQVLAAPAEQASLLVAVRVRPILPGEHQQGRGKRDILRVMDRRVVLVLDPDETKDYLDQASACKQLGAYCYMAAIQPLPACCVVLQLLDAFADWHNVGSAGLASAKLLQFTSKCSMHYFLVRLPQTMAHNQLNAMQFFTCRFKIAPRRSGTPSTWLSAPTPATGTCTKVGCRWRSCTAPMLAPPQPCVLCAFLMPSKRRWMGVGAGACTGISGTSAGCTELHSILLYSNHTTPSILLILLALCFTLATGRSLYSVNAPTGTIARLVGRVADGMNATVFAYGATGSGKTHTMVGECQALLLTKAERSACMHGCGLGILVAYGAAGRGKAGIMVGAELVRLPLSCCSVCRCPVSDGPRRIPCASWLRREVMCSGLRHRRPVAQPGTAFLEHFTTL